MKQILIALLFAAAASAQPFVFAPETPVSQPRIGLAASSFGTMRIASDGTNFLLVWGDDRGSLPAHTDYLRRHYSTFMTRVDGQGNVLDVPNIELPGFGEAWPFWDGRQYVIAGSTGKYVRMSAAGEMLDAVPRTISSMPHGVIINMLWSGERLLVAGRTYGQGVPDELYLTMYDRLFNVVRGEFLFDSSQSSLGNIAMATNGRDFLIVNNPCHGNCSLNITTLDREGSIVRRAPPLLGYLYNTMTIASDGNGYLLVHDTPKSPYGQWNYAGDLLDAAGNIYGSAGPFGPNNILPYPGFALAWEGDGYQFVYSRGTFDAVPGDDQFVLRAMTLDSAGKSSDYVGTALQSLTHRPTPLVAAFGMPGKHVVMTLGSDSYEASDPLLWEGRIYDSPAHYATAPEFTVGQGVLPQESPASATNGEVSLLAWREAEKGSIPFALFAARVDSHGHTLDAAPLRLASATCNESTPRVATNGRDFLVAWQDSGGVKAMRISRDGGLLDTVPITIFADDKQRCSAAASSRPAVGWNGSDYLVAWSGAVAGVSAVRVAPDGTLRDAAPIRIASENGLTKANVASDGKDFFVAWETPQNVAFGAHVTAAGNASGATSLNVVHPSLIFWTGTSYAILSADSDGLRAVRVSRDGQPVDQQPLLFAAPADARDAQGSCDASGCYAFGITDGVVVTTRIEETSSGLRATSTPLAHTNGAWQQLIVFGAERTQFGYLEPYLGSYHLFTTQLLAARGHAVRSRP